MKVALLVYHNNIQDLYPQEWIDEFRLSIYNQTFQDFEILELNYGSSYFRIFPDSNFHQTMLPNHIHAMNMLINHADINSFDIVFNTNCDDVYHPQRMEFQINKINEGYDLVSSNFKYFGDKVKLMKMDHYNIRKELNKNHNVICHPVVCTHMRFWNQLRYNDILGSEDLDLWKRAITAGRKFYILEEYLLKYRIHKNQVTKSWPK